MAIAPQGPVRSHHPLESARAAFWTIALGVIVAFLFFLVLGAFSLGEVVPAAIVIGVLCLLWIAHGLDEQRHSGSQQSHALRTIRERRGF